MTLAHQSPTSFDTHGGRCALGPVTWSDDHDAWVVVGFAECDEVLRDGETFAGHNKDSVSPRPWKTLTETLGGERAPMLLPEPKHTQLGMRMRKHVRARITPQSRPTSRTQ